MTKYHVGIDLHKTVAQVCVTDEQGGVVAERRLPVADAADGRALVNFLAQWREGGRFVVEAIGMNRWLVNACREIGLDLVVADAAKLGLSTLGKKTDRRDALEMARRLRLGDIDRHAVTYYPSDREHGVRKLVRVRHGLVHVRQEFVNQARGLLNAYLVRPPVAELHSRKGLAWLRTCTLPTETMTACLRAIAVAMTSVQEQIDGLSARVDAVGKEETVRGLEEYPPGVGALTATTLAYELGDVTRFRNARAAASYAGLVPKVAQSADTSHHGRLTKRGSRV